MFKRNNIVKNNNLIFLLSLLGILGFGISLYSSRWGSGIIDWDTFNYISSARNFAKGLGLSIPLDNVTLAPLTHFPPFLPIVLSIIEIIGVDALSAIRWLNAFLFGANIFLIGYITYYLTSSVFFAIASAVVFCVSESFIVIHALALSEPLFIFLTLLGFFFLFIYSEDKKIIYLVVTFLVFILSSLTKYIGMVNILTVIFFYFILNKSFAFTNIAKGIGLFIIAIFPLLLWTIRGVLYNNTFNNRVLSWYPITIGNVIQTLRTFLSVYFPKSIIIGNEKWLFLILLLILVILFYNVHKNKQLLFIDAKIGTALATLFFYIVVYYVIVMLSKQLFDPNIGMSSRMFAPIISLLIITTMIFFSFIYNNTRNYVIRSAIVIFCIYWGTFQALYGFQEALYLHNNGFGLARKSIQRSEVIKKIKNDLSSEDIYTNNPYLLYFIIGKPGYRISSFEITPENSGKYIFVYKQSSLDGYKKLLPYLKLFEEDHIVSLYQFSY